MELIPLVIFLAGIIYSVIASMSKNNDEEKRNVDTSKMERQGKSAPRRRQPSSDSKESKPAGGLFEDFQREFQQEYDKAMGNDASEEQRSGKTSPRMAQDKAQRKVKDFQEEYQKRQQQSNEQENRGRFRDERRRGTYRDKEITDGYSKDDASIDRVSRDSGIGREVSDEARHEYGDDRTDAHQSKRQQEKYVAGRDMTFDQKSVVNGVIFSEILNQPVSRNRIKR